MVHLGPKTPQSRHGLMADVPQTLLDLIEEYKQIFTVPGSKLQQISTHFVSELEKGLSVKGGNIPMIPGWVMLFPTGEETGDFLAIDLGGTNLRVVLVTLLGGRKFETRQLKYLLPAGIRTLTADALWGFIADSLKKFVDEEFPSGCTAPLPLGFTFLYPALQGRINEGVLQRWTKGFDIPGVEDHDVVPMLQKAIADRNIPIEIVALINDTTGTLVASMYTDPETKMGLIFGTGVNGAYYDVIGEVPKIAGRMADDTTPDMPMAINCEYGLFDNEHLVLPRTKFDVLIDKQLPRPGQQAFEKMISGYYLGEVLRLVLLEQKEMGRMFVGQDCTKLNEPFVMDASYPSLIEQDPFENLSETEELLREKLGISTTEPERKLIRVVCELIGTRAARLSVCGIAAVCKKRGYASGHFAADGSVYNKYPLFGKRAAQGLREIFEWKDGEEDKYVIVPAEDGSGVGAAIIAALTQKRLAKGLSVGFKQ